MQWDNRNPHLKAQALVVIAYFLAASLTAVLFGVVFFGLEAGVGAFLLVFLLLLFDGPPT